MTKKSKLTTTAIVGLIVITMVAIFWRYGGTETLMYYDETADQCYQVMPAHYRYTVEFDPADFDVETGFRITHIKASADIPTGLPVPLLISNALPPTYPDSSLYRQDIVFTDATWDTFDLITPFEWKTKFWVQIIYHSLSGNPFSQSVLEDSASRKRNLVETTYGWGPNDCNMAIGVIIETPSGLEEYIPDIPKIFVLEQNYPNPFNPTTMIGFSLDRCDQVTLSVYDVRGRLVTILLNKPLGPGRHEVIWRGGDHRASGVYFYQLMVGEWVERRRMVLSK